jgi:hypothetical protein
VVSESETSCTKGADSTEGDSGSGELSTDNDVPLLCGVSEVKDGAVAVEHECKVLSDGGTAGLFHVAACCPFRT